ncbi:MAG: T9SS type A sorting domain-containing protein [Lewinellaceae bacterium]|nr:T9SS type A sorting domain-containing protein [Lewinellaceae bacterium]
MRKLIAPLLFLLMSCAGSTQTAQKIASGYYPSWRWYERGKLVRPATLDFSKYDIVTYAFLDVEADGSLSLFDPWADKNLLLGPINAATAPTGYGQANDLGNPAFHKRGMRFSDYAHKHRTRFTVSIGGWAHSENFPAIAADPAKRARFAADCARIVELYNLDGIDIDWEYPGTEERGGSPADRQNFTLLLLQVRETLQTLKTKIRRDLMLTIACGAAPKNMANIDWPLVHKLVDGINLMSYSFYGHWDPVSNHNAPLFPSINATQLGYSCVEAVQNLLDFGVPAAKINLGLAFYGRTQLTAGQSGLHVNSQGQPDTIAFPRSAATPQYHEIVARMNEGLYQYNWDEAALAPYLTGKEGIPSFVSFDDEHSIALKAQFAKSRNLRGTVVWDITADYLETAPGSKTISGTPLAAAVRRVFSSTEPLPLVLTGTTVCVFPNPTPNGYIQVFTNSAERANTNLTIFDANGKKIHAATYTTAAHRVDMRPLPAGPYMVQVKHGNSNAVQVQVLKK